MKRPLRIRSVFCLSEKRTPEGFKTVWTLVGDAYDARDGTTLVKLHAIPMSSMLVLRAEPVDTECTENER